MNFGRKSLLDGIRDRGRNIKIPVMIILVLILVQAFIGATSIKLLFNLNALQIIVSGILISVLISYPTELIIRTIKTVKASFTDEIDFEMTINKIYNLSIKIKKDGLLSIQDDIQYEEDVFIRDAMILLNDYKKEETIEDIMDHDIESRYIELMKPYNVMQMVANIAPAFGLIGTLVGMIGLLNNISQPTQIMGNMASALISTLYGSLIANFLAFPLMARIQEYNAQQVLEYRMIKEGILLIARGDTTRNVFDKMNVMLREEKRLVYPRNRYGQAVEERGSEDYGVEEFL